MGVKVQEESGPARPVRVSLSGLDGAGKSHQVAALVESQQQRRTVEQRWVPFDIWPGQLLTIVPAWIRKRIGPDGRTVATGQRLVAEGERSVALTPPPRHTGALQTAFWYVVGTLSAVSAGFNLRTQVKESSADLLVLDRFRIDSVARLSFWYPDVSPRWLARIVMAIAPRPDLEILLRVAGDTAYARKPEQYDVKQLRLQARLLDELGSLSTVFVAVDGEQPPEVVAKEVDAHVSRLFGDR